MRLFTLDRSVEMIKGVVNDYVVQVAQTYMSSKKPQNVLSIHRKGTKDEECFAHVKLRETPTVSMFKCEVYLDDINRLCRDCKLYLQTERNFPVIVLWYILHPLYQSQYKMFTSDLVHDYAKMMIDAGEQTYEYIYENYPMRSAFKRVTLEVLRYKLITECRSDISSMKQLARVQKQYKKYCNQYYHDAYAVAALRRGHNCMVDEDGFIRIERLRSSNNGKSQSKNVSSRKRDTSEGQRAEASY